MEEIEKEEQVIEKRMREEELQKWISNNKEMIQKKLKPE